MQCSALQTETKNMFWKC